MSRGLDALREVFIIAIIPVNISRVFVARPQNGRDFFIYKIIIWKIIVVENIAHEWQVMHGGLFWASEHISIVLFCVN